MEVSENLCKSILTRSSGYLQPVCSHSLNPYKGCGFGRSSCGVACYVQFNPWLTRGRPWGTFVEVKTNAVEAYRRTFDSERRWAHRRGIPFCIFLSSSTDPWQPVEKKYRVTRGLLEAMCDLPPDELILQTHSTAIRDDLDLIQKLQTVCRVRVHISLEGDRDRLPGLPPPPCSTESRMALLEEFSDAGIPTIACLSPLYPLEDPEQFFQRLMRTGIRAVVIDHFIVGDGTPDGARTLQTPLPEAMERVLHGSTRLEYRNRIVAQARKILPVGVSQSGFAGVYSQSSEPR